MNSTQNAFSLRKISCSLLALGGLLLWQPAVAQPSQDPLLNRDGGGVTPNVMLTLDDSGSMMFQHMPEVTGYVGPWDSNKTSAQNNTAGAWAVTMPPGQASVVMDPDDTRRLSGFYIGVIASQRGNSNYRQKMMRSPDVNTLYYNPNTRYLPWAVSTFPLPAATASKPAGRMANSPPTAAYRDPMNTGGGGTVNLTNVRNENKTWCYRDARTDCSDNSESYDPGLYYRLKKNGAGNFLDPSNAANYTEYSINNTPTAYPTKAVDRVDCAGATCTETEERNNYANWFTYYRNRNFLARGAMMEAFKSADASPATFRLGWGRINASGVSLDGVNTGVIQAGVRDYAGATKTNLFTWLGALPANGGTPLPAAMDAVGQYFTRTDSRGPWSDTPGTTTTASQKSCRRNYQIMVTDGYWSGAVSVGNVDASDGPALTGSGRTYQYTPTYPYKDVSSDTLADVAMKYWVNDLRGTSPALTNNVVPTADNPAFWQHMVNFMVGLGLRGKFQPPDPANPLSIPGDLPALTSGAKRWDDGDKIDDLWHAAVNSRGAFFTATDPTELADAVTKSLSSALKRELREAGVATASTVLQEGNRKYVPMYKTGDWTGDIQAFTLDSNGQAGVVTWTAQTKIASLPYTSRNIWTWRSDTSAPAAFNWTSMGSNSQAALGTGANAALVNYLRGDRTNEDDGLGNGMPYRKRLTVLGDFIDSNPVLIKDAVDMGYSTLSPSFGGGTPYTNFLVQKKARTAVLFVGGNDGMLHAFKDTLGATPSEDGKEIFAYVPRVGYPELSKLSDKLYGSPTLNHRFFVDGALKEADAYIGSSWKNLLLGSMGPGGRAVFALDVTDTANLTGSSIAWEISSATNGDLGYVSSALQVGVLANGEWVAVFGNGRYSDNGKAVLFVVNLATKAVQTLVVESAGSNGLGGVAMLRDSFGIVTNLYAGDLKGNLWKFDYDGTTASRFKVNASSSGGMFQARSPTNVAQPITEAPLIYPFPTTQVASSGGSTCSVSTLSGGYLVTFGTGVLSTVADANSTAVQSIYAVWDKPSDTVSRPILRGMQGGLSKVGMEPRVLTQYTGSDITAGVFYGSSGNRVDWANQRGWVLDLAVSGIDGLRVVYPPQKVGQRMGLYSTVAPARNVAVCDEATGSGINLFLDSGDGGDVGPPPVSGSSTYADYRKSGFDATTSWAVDRNRDGVKNDFDANFDPAFDINHDGQITIADCGAFDARFDTNRDGKIDSLDRLFKGTFDTNGDGKIDGSDRAVAGYATGADGIDAVVLGATVCVGGVCNQKVSFQNTTGQITANTQEVGGGFCNANVDAACSCAPGELGSWGACCPAGSTGTYPACLTAPPPAPPFTAVRERIWRSVVNPPIR